MPALEDPQAGPSSSRRISPHSHKSSSRHSPRLSPLEYEAPQEANKLAKPSSSMRKPSPFGHQTSTATFQRMIPVFGLPDIEMLEPSSSRLQPSEPINSHELKRSKGKTSEAHISKHRETQAALLDPNDRSLTNDPAIQKYLPYSPSTTLYPLDEDILGEFNYQPDCTQMTSWCQKNPQANSFRKVYRQLGRVFYHVEIPSAHENCYPSPSCEQWASHYFRLLDTVKSTIGLNMSVYDMEELLPIPEWPEHDCLFTSHSFELKDDGSNYNAWKFCQTTVLKLRGLFGVANGTNNLPNSLTKAEQKDKSKVSHYKDLIAKWTRRDKDAFAQIMLNMEDGAMQWEGKGVQSLLFLYQQLTLTKILEDDNIATGLNNLLSIASKMKTLGEPVSNLMMAQIMMNALPPTYAIVNTIIQTTNQASAVTPQMVKEAALKEEEHCKNSTGITAMFLHLPAKPLNSKLSKSKNKCKKDKGPACLNCGKSGHLKQECWAKGGGAEGTGLRQKNNAKKQSKDKGKEPATKTKSAKVAVTTNNLPPILYALPATDSQTSNNSWLLDSGASKHMTPNQKWFATYQSLTSPIHV
ncbi:Copia-like polyprotein/retrotransposon [Rhizoctonia solani]|uniref:Copia-like polyprotein/retrotransposon n=1 Tax=Rhizoctonia solani TaxID=456999 RepID=A0A8H8ST68_9AGAM|nr:Copia-like polyprotein/retrotransposon [Rhizoctonia solani]QRW17546.1 Copia-like polyprotein/retrotransposon [Rhizoctonia solani]